ncbi:MAG: hypothetical protein ACI4WS_13040 [Oscillospiraceae bacterium]
MPNHITNRLVIDGEETEIRRLLDTVTTKDEQGNPLLDFDKIIPMPKEIDIPPEYNRIENLSNYLSAVNPMNEETVEGIAKLPVNEYKELIAALKSYYSDFRQISISGDSHIVEKESAERGQRVAHNILNYGAPIKYEWCLQNWYIGSNSISAEPFENNTLVFKTALTRPEAIIDRLSSLFPSLSFEHRWADEDFGYNVGTATYKNGEKVETYIPQCQTVESCQLAAEILGYSPEWYESLENDESEAEPEP